MKRYWILLALGALVAGCNPAEEKTGSNSPTSGESTKVAGDSTKTDTKGEEAKSSEKKDNPDVIKTVRPDGTVEQRTKDGKNKMVMNPKTGLGTIETLDKYKDKMTIDRSGNVPTSEVAVPDYPGGKVPPREPKVVKITSYGGWEWAMVRETKDDPAKVFAFYKKVISDAKESGTEPKILKGKVKGDRVTILMAKAKDGGYRLTIATSRRNPSAKPRKEPDKPPAGNGGAPPPPPTGANPGAPMGSKAPGATTPGAGKPAGTISPAGQPKAPQARTDTGS